jgi:dinuclear metal center YbgI/SA1388 family protein
MPLVHDIVVELERIAPLSLAEDWDNVGLLVGDRGRTVQRVMTCLTLMPTTVAEAVERQADMVVVHHPLPFQPLAQLTTDTTVGRLLWELIGARVAVYSAHTAFDSAREGINARWAEALLLKQVEPMSETVFPEYASRRGSGEGLGAGRCGALEPPTTLDALANHVKRFLSITQVRIVGANNQAVRRVAVACGSGGSFLESARAKACDCLVTGEANFHTCLEAEATGVAMVLTGHYASERFAMEQLAVELAELFPGLAIWASQRERDPLSVV